MEYDFNKAIESIREIRLNAEDKRDLWERLARLQDEGGGLNVETPVSGRRKLSPYVRLTTRNIVQYFGVVILSGLILVFASKAPETKSISASVTAPQSIHVKTQKFSPVPTPQFIEPETPVGTLKSLDSANIL